MKIVDAIWEKRNLGVKTVEITIDEEDLIGDVREKLSNLNDEYIVIKTPSLRIDMNNLLNDFGYTFIEGSINMTHNLKDINLNRIQERLIEQVTYELMNKNDLEQLYNEIKNGMFNTDRIFLDPYFTNEQASSRYLGWIKDEIERGTDIYKLIYKGINFGFFSFKDLGDGVYYPFLAGLYADYRNTGLGMVYNYKPLCEAKKRNGRLVSTYISTNNFNVVRMHVTMGFQFNQIDYVFIKHNVI